MLRADDPLILAAAAVVNGAGSLAPVEDRLAALDAAGVSVRALQIEPLRAPWRGTPDPRGPGFQSGCAPILALARAATLLARPEVDAVILRGDEPLRTGYSRPERQALMRVYPDLTLPEAYTRLAELLLSRLGLSEAGYWRLADALLDNYGRTALRRGLATRDAAAGRRPITRLLRLADCADPNLDFQGALLLGTARTARCLGLSPGALPRLAAAAVELVPDGPEHLADIVGYDHLRRAYDRACAAAGVDFTARFRAGEALCEAYTCFPPVPLGFVLATSLAARVADIEGLLARRELTVTGGMNRAGAPWNNPALYALVVMCQRLETSTARVGLVHGNGGVGGYQGVALITGGDGAPGA